MTLQTQLIDVNFDQGIDTRDDSFLVTGKYDKMINCIRNKAGGIEKRNGFSELSKTGLTGTILSIKEIDNVLMAITTTGTYRYSSSSLSWSKVGCGASLNVDKVAKLLPTDHISIGVTKSNGLNIVVSAILFPSRGTPFYKVYLNVVDDSFSQILSQTRVVGSGIGAWCIRNAKIHELSDGRFVFIAQDTATGITACLFNGVTQVAYYEHTSTVYNLKASCIYGSYLYFCASGAFDSRKIPVVFDRLTIGSSSLTLTANSGFLKTVSNEGEDFPLGTCCVANSVYAYLVDPLPTSGSGSFTITGAGTFNTTVTVAPSGSSQAAKVNWLGSNGTTPFLMYTAASASETTYISFSTSGTGPYGGSITVKVGTSTAQNNTTTIYPNGYDKFYFSYSNNRGQITFSIAASIVGGVFGATIVTESTVNYPTSTLSVRRYAPNLTGMVLFSGPAQADTSGYLEKQCFINSSNNLAILEPVRARYTRQTLIPLTMDSYTQTTYAQGAICSQIFTDLQSESCALFLEYTTKSVLMVRLSDFNVKAVLNQGNAWTVSEISTYYGYSDGAFNLRNNLECFASSYGLYTIPKEPEVTGITYTWESSLIKTSLASTSNISTLQLTKNGYFTGGFLGVFNQNFSSEVGFFQAPRIDDSPSVYTAGGSLGSGSYVYGFVFSYISPSGDKVESQVSSTSITTTTSTSSVNFTVAPLSFTNRQVSYCRLDIYRTKVNGSILYKLNSIIMTGNEPMVIPDATSDSSLTGAASIYTTGGILNNSPIGACYSLWATKNRIFVVSSEEKTKIFYSKEKLTGYDFEFTGLQYIDCNGGQFEGDITAGGGLDEKIIIAKDRYLLGIYGDGPNAAGGGTDFSIPQLISTDVGVSDKNSIITTPDGLMFKTNKGIYLLNRSLQVVYIGVFADAYAQTTINCSSMAIKENLVFFGIQGNILVYDYFLKNWFIWNGLNDVIDAVSSCIYNDNLTILNSASKILTQNSGYVDQNGNIIREIETSWVEAGSVQGFQRLRRIMFLGHGYGAASLDIKISRDYDPTVLETHTLAITETSGAKIQSNLHVANQKMNTVKINIKDTGTGTAYNNALSGMTFELGLKKGTEKLAAGRKF